MGGGHAGGQSGPIHVGLGSADRAEFRVIWPDGGTSSWKPLALNRVTRIHRNVLLLDGQPAGHGFGDPQPTGQRRVIP